ncbi:MAG: glutamine-hydrolyzing carbamoyl-phosphate synthase small subunit [Bacteroidales bacterium]
MKAVLALEDGTCFEGTAVGAHGEAGGEVVFNTSMTGYQEILTDPSYAGQIVTMTAVEIGNYGVTIDDVESRAPQVAGFVVRDASPIASNWRASDTLERYLQDHAIVAIAGVDTRALTRKLRSAGVMRGVIATGDVRLDDAVAKAQALPPMEGADLVRGVTCDTPFDWPRGDVPESDLNLALPTDGVASRRLRVAAYDYGVKWNLLRRLAAYGCDVCVYPATTPAATILATQPDGVFLSNGPGDPAAVDYAVRNVRTLLDEEVPLFGVCLGHQLLALAVDARTYKLKFGHRGGNHPVSRLDSGKVEITSQNHGFAVDRSTLPAHVEVTHLNLYDGTVEGLRHRTKPAFSVQYHPEASPGPHDSDYLFKAFIDEMERRS